MPGHAQVIVRNIDEAGEKNEGRGRPRAKGGPRETATIEYQKEGSCDSTTAEAMMPRHARVAEAELWKRGTPRDVKLESVKDS